MNAGVHGTLTLQINRESQVEQAHAFQEQLSIPGLVNGCLVDPDPNDLDSLYDILEDREQPYCEHREPKQLADK